MACLPGRCVITSYSIHYTKLYDAAGPINLGVLWYSKYLLFLAVLSLILLVLVWFFLEKTPYGSIIKAGVSDSEMVLALGKNLGKLRTLVFGLGAFLAGIAGVIAGPMWSLIV